MAVGMTTGRARCVRSWDKGGAHHGVRVAKPRTAPRRGGAMRTSRPTAMRHGAVCAATVHGQCAWQRGARGAWFLRTHFENHKEQRGRAFVFLSLHRNGLCVPLCSFSRGAGPHHGALRRDGEPPHPLAKKRLRRTFQLTESVTYANMNATRDEFLFRPCGKFPFDKSSISRFSIP